MQPFVLLDLAGEAARNGPDCATIEPVQHHGVGHQPCHAAVAIHEWMYPPQVMVGRGRGDDGLCLACVTVNLREAFQEAGHGARTDGDVVSVYPGEPLTRHFNLTHEWLAQVVFYLVWRIAGFGGVVLFRALLLSACCGLVGLVAYRRCLSFYWALAAAFAAATMARPFALDRPYLI